MLVNEKPYYSLDYYLKTRFGEKVYKVTIDAGMTCPNRDGSIDTRGCIFCSASGSGDFAGDSMLSITEQIEHGIEGLAKFHSNRFIAYFQAFTNTYASLPYLRKVYTEAISQENVAVLSIATRPDCIDEEIVALLVELQEQYQKPVWVELGLQTIHEKTAKYIRRGYQLPCFEKAVKLLRNAGIEVIVHVILGLPEESKEQMIQTVTYLNHMDIQGIKLQLLHVLSDTDLAIDYEAGKFHVLEEDEYVEIVAECIGRLSPDIVIHRLTGDGPKDLLLAPLWSTSKMKVLNHIHHYLKVEKIRQGCMYDRGLDDVRATNTI